MQISILQGSSFGTAVYVETHLPNTNVNGLVSLEIGAILLLPHELHRLGVDGRREVGKVQFYARRVVVVADTQLAEPEPAEGGLCPVHLGERGERHRRAVRDALRIDGNRAARRQRHTLRPGGAEAGIELGQAHLAEEHGARVAPEHLVDAARVLVGPGLDGFPGGFADGALVEQPAADALVGMAVVAGEGDAHLALAAVGLGDVEPAGALDLQDERVNGVGEPGDGLALQRGLGGGQGVDVFAAVPGLAGAQTGGRRVERRAVGGAGQAAGAEDGFVVAGEQALGQAAVALHDAVGLEAALDPGALFGGRGDGERARFVAEHGMAGDRPFTAAQPGVPGFVQAVLPPAGQFAPAHRRPQALAALQGGRQRAAVDHAGHVHRRARGHGNGRARREQAAYNAGRQPTSPPTAPTGPTCHDFAVA